MTLKAADLKKMLAGNKQLAELNPEAEQIVGCLTEPENTLPILQRDRDCFSFVPIGCVLVVAGIRRHSERYFILPVAEPDWRETTLDLDKWSDQEVTYQEAMRRKQ